MALGKLAQSSCCRNCAVCTSRVYELTMLSLYFGLKSSHACWLSHLKPYMTFRPLICTQSQWKLSNWHLLSTCNLENWFEIWKLRPNGVPTPHGVFPFPDWVVNDWEGWQVCRDRHIRCLSSQHNLTKVLWSKVLHLSLLTSTKIPIANPFSSSCH